jgi:hypothetical protein
VDSFHPWNLFAPECAVKAPEKALLEIAMGRLSRFLSVIDIFSKSVRVVDLTVKNLSK